MTSTFFRGNVKKFWIDYANGEEIALCIKMGFAWKFQGKLNSIEEVKSGVIFIIIWYFLNR